MNWGVTALRNGDQEVSAFGGSHNFSKRVMEVIGQKKKELRPRHFVSFRDSVNI